MLLVDDYVLYRKITSEIDTYMIQRDLDKISSWCTKMAYESELKQNSIYGAHKKETLKFTPTL